MFLDSYLSMTLPVPVTITRTSLTWEQSGESIDVQEYVIPGTGLCTTWMCREVLQPVIHRAASYAVLCCAQSCPNLCSPMDCNLPSSSVHGIFQARIILEQVAISFSRGSFWPRDWTHISCISCIGRWMHHLGSPTGREMLMWIEWDIRGQDQQQRWQWKDSFATSEAESRLFSTLKREWLPFTKIIRYHLLIIAIILIS